MPRPNLGSAPNFECGLGKSFNVSETLVFQVENHFEENMTPLGYWEDGGREPARFISRTALCSRPGGL